MPGEQETTSSEQTTETVATPSLVTEGTTTESTEETTEQTEEQTETVEVVPLTTDDLTFPEGFEVDETIRDDFLALINDAEKSPKDRAQALIDLQVKAATVASEASSKLWTETQEKWQAETKAAPEFAGDKLQPSLERIGKLINEYGTDDLKQVFDLTGAGNNVHVVRFLNKVAEQLTEASAPATGAPVNQSSSAASRLFPSMKEG